MTLLKLRAFYLLVFLGILLTAQPVWAAKRLALVVGNAKYGDDIGALRYSVADANEIARILRDELGFEVALLTDADSATLNKQIAEFGERLENERAEVGLFYYAGHGFTRNGEHYLMPVDTPTQMLNADGTPVPPEIKTDWIAEIQSTRAVSTDKVAMTMEGSGALVRVLVIDAFHRNPAGPPGLPLFGVGNAPMTTASGTLIALTATPGRKVVDPPSKEARNSLYASILLEVLPTPGLKVRDIFKRTSDLVSSRTDQRQQPWTSAMFVPEVELRRDPDAAGSIGTSKTGESVTELDGMVRVSAGPFLMDNDRRRVVVGEFWIDRTEVSVESYMRCVKAKKCGTDAMTTESYDEPGDSTGKEHCNLGKREREKHPVNCVSWYQASQYCAWLGKRLPEADQWEKAARGQDGRLYPWGNGAYEAVQEPVANIADESVARQFPDWSGSPGYDDGYAATAPVGSYPKGRSPYGVDDMVGNVAEWSADWYPDREGDVRMVRGSAWNDTSRVATITDRKWFVPRGRDPFTGFRCARD